MTSSEVEVALQAITDEDERMDVLMYLAEAFGVEVTDKDSGERKTYYLSTTRRDERFCSLCHQFFQDPNEVIRCPECVKDFGSDVLFPPDPKSQDGKKVPAMVYVNRLPEMTDIARSVGYAIAFHGSMSRDLDCIAAPWVEGACSAAALAGLMARRLGGRILENKKAMPKPHGREAFTIVFGGRHHIDLSVMPRNEIYSSHGGSENHRERNDMSDEIQEKETRGAFMVRTARQILSDSKVTYQKLGERTTICHVICPNGHELVGTAFTCDPKVYDEEIGKRCALEDAQNQLITRLTYHFDA